MVYRGDRLPAELYGNVFIVDPTVNLVSRVILSDSENGLTADKAYRDVRGEFLASTDERFRPVNLSLAPDGTLYVVDMYRGIIQHKGYMTEYLRDYVLTHELEQPNSYGRIYRIVHESTKRDTTPFPMRATPAQLASVARRTRTAGAATWRSSCSSSAATSRSYRHCGSWRRAPDVRTRLKALWVLDGLDAIEPTDVMPALVSRRTETCASPRSGCRSDGCACRTIPFMAR